MALCLAVAGLPVAWADVILGPDDGAPEKPTPPPRPRAGRAYPNRYRDAGQETENKAGCSQGPGDSRMGLASLLVAGGLSLAWVLRRRERRH